MNECAKLYDFWHIETGMLTRPWESEAKLRLTLRPKENCEAEAEDRYYEAEAVARDVA